MSHTKQALRLGYSVLAMDPSDSRHQCWSSSSSRAGYINDQPNASAAAAAAALLLLLCGCMLQHAAWVGCCAWLALARRQQAAVPGGALFPCVVALLPTCLPAQPTPPACCPPARPQVVEAVTRFVADHGLAGKRLILWGASSGGTLALKLPGTLAAMAQRGAAGAGAGQVAASQAAVGPVLRLTGIISGGGRGWG